MTVVKTAALVSLVVLSALCGSASAQFPSWYLASNTPEPFCSEDGSGTTIEFGVGVAAHIALDVLDEGMTSVVRHLIDGSRDAGVHMVVWDGRDSLGVWVANGTYPYRMTATDEGATVLFEDTKVAHVYCDTPVSAGTWGAIKELYR